MFSFILCPGSHAGPPSINSYAWLHAGLIIFNAINITKILEDRGCACTVSIQQLHQLKVVRNVYRRRHKNFL